MFQLSLLCDRLQTGQDPIFFCVQDWRDGDFCDHRSRFNLHTESRSNDKDCRRSETVFKKSQSLSVSLLFVIEYVFTYLFVLLYDIIIKIEMPQSILVSFYW